MPPGPRIHRMLKTLANELMKPVQVSGGENNIVVLCDDGSIWRLHGSTWKMLPPLPSLPSLSSLSDSPSTHTHNLPHTTRATPEPAPAGPPRARKTEQLQLVSTPETLNDDLTEFVAVWNGYFSLPRVSTLGSRVSLLLRALKDPYFHDNWRDGIRSLVNTPFCMGKNRRGWKADLVWFLNPENLEKLINGQYNYAHPEKETANFERTEI